MFLGHAPELIILLVLLIVVCLIPFFCIRYFVTLHARTTARELDRRQSERPAD